MITAWVVLPLVLAIPLSSTATAGVPHVGDRAAALAGMDRSTSPPTPVDIADFSGRWVLVDFWSTSCAICIAGMPDVLTATQPYRSSGQLELLLVNLDPGSQVGFAANYAGPPGPGVSEIHTGGRPLPADAEQPPPGTARQAIDWGISAVPAMYLLDPQGNIVAKHLRHDDLEQALAYCLSDDYARPPIGLRCWVAERPNDTLALNIELGNPRRNSIYVEIDYRLVSITQRTSSTTGRIYPEVTAKWNPLRGSPEETLLLRLDQQPERTYTCIVPLEGHQGIEYRVRAVPEENWQSGEIGLWLVQGGEYYIGFPSYCREYAN